MKIYTRTGDKGDTGLFGGGRVDKDHPRVDAYGEVDEPNAVLGMARAANREPRINKIILGIQRDLFSIGALLATPDHKKMEDHLAKAVIGEDRIAELESFIDECDRELEPLKAFIVPGGTPKSAALHGALCWRLKIGMRTSSGMSFQEPLPLLSKKFQRPTRVSPMKVTPAMIARVIAKRIAKFHTSPTIEARLKFFEAKEAALAAPRNKVARIPYYCSGCPHNTSTRVPEGSKALAGIGCHYMAIWIRPEETMTFTQMGGEGAPWIGIQPFTQTKHVFANLGDGTYFHSGLLAVRAAVSAGVNITYKILYNDAVAMTGGQPHDGPLTAPMIVRQVLAEGVKKAVVVSDDIEKYKQVSLPIGVDVKHRDDLDQVQRELREIEGTTVLVYDQTCAAEKRRRRKRGTFPDPQKRVVINDLVCEGCGDCSVKSNCLSVVPLETEFGRKRAIDQSTCNKDYSCVKGFCPSFITVEGGQLRKPKSLVAPAQAGAQALDPRLRGDDKMASPPLPALDRPYGILVTGVGGTGVVTIGAILGMAAHIEGKGVAVLDMTGLAQKGGSVYSHIRIARKPEELHAVRIAAGDARLVIGCDMIVAASDEAIAKMQAGFTHAVINSGVAPTGGFVRDPDLKVPADEMAETIREACGPERADFVDATALATALLGDSIATNLFMVGYAWQKGLVPLSQAAILQAIDLNGAAVESNKKAFEWGRRAAVDVVAVQNECRSRAGGNPVGSHSRAGGNPAGSHSRADGNPAGSHSRADGNPISQSLEELIDRRRAFLEAYQDAAYAQRYTEFVGRVRHAEATHAGGRTALTEAVARYLFKLMAYKDEYEVARLHTGTGFLERVAQQFEGDYQVKLHLAPPLWAKPDPVTGEPRKRSFGPWMLGAMRVLAKLKGLRGTPLDVFGYSEERRTERRLIEEYRATVEELLQGLEGGHHALAVEIASIPEFIRGFGHVKARHLRDAKAREAKLLEQWRNPKAAAAARIPIAVAA